MDETGKVFSPNKIRILAFDIRGGALLFFLLMKHIITITSLLAAGTLLANAAISLSENSNNSLSQGVFAYWDFSGSQTMWSDYYTSVGTSGSFESNVSLSNNVSGGVLDSTSGWSGNNPYNGPSWSDSAVTISFRVKNWSEGVLLQLTDNENSRIQSTAGKLAFGTYDSGYSVDGDFWTTVTFVSVPTGGSYDQTTQLYINGNVFTPSGVSNWDSTGFWYGLGSKRLKQIGTAWGGGTKFKGVLDDLTIWNRVLSTEEIRAFASGSTPLIPEPSAFGLLAGLGALALAGTRRRRRK
ncbi:MAG: LamG-like jellyroll fold domain-containing protein [Candidatus Spyradosoma sp.]